MARNKKSVLNQMIGKSVVEETKTEKEEVVEVPAKLFAPEIESVIPMAEPVVKSETKTNSEISLKVSGEKLAEALEKNKRVDEELEEDVEEEVVEEVPRPAGIRSLDAETRNRLSRSELRFFQRTGILPK